MRSLPRRLSLIVFDMDGVLVNTTPVHTRAYADLWREIGIVDPPAYSAIAGRRTSDVVAEVTRARKPSQAEIEKWVHFKQQRVREYLLTESIEFPDTVEVVRKFSCASRLAVGTSASRETANAILQRLGIRELFRSVIAAEDVQVGKPSPEVYLRTIALADVDPEQTLVVEDSASGLQAALDSGAFAVIVRTTEHSEHPRFLGSFADLRTLLETLPLPQ